MDILVDTALKTRHATGENRVALLGEAVSDYSRIEDLCWELTEEGFQIPTPSLRVESLSDELLEILKSNGLKTITIAPETVYSQRLKLNKPMTDSQILNTIDRAIDLKFKVKMYLLLGTPGETTDNVMDLVNFIRSILSRGVRYNTIKTSVNPLIPKPHTPLQYMGFDYDTIDQRFKKYAPRLKYRYDKESLRKSAIQYVLSNSGVELNKILKYADKIKFKDWYKILQNLNKVKSKNNYSLAWDEIDVGVKNKFLRQEYDKITTGEITRWCEEGGCYNCGSC